MWNKNTLLIISAQWLSLFGSKLHLLALPLLIFQQTGSTQLMALGFLAETLPWTFIAPKLSQMLQKANFKTILITSDLLSAFFCFVLAFMKYHTLSFMAVMLLIGICNSIYGSFRIELVRTSLAKDNIQKFLSTINSGNQFIRVFAPAAGGGLLAIGVSAKGLLIFDALTFVGSALLLSLTYYKPNDLKQKVEIPLSGGWQLIRQSKSLWPTTVTEALRSVAEALFNPVLVVLVTKVFLLNEAHLGIAQTCYAVGGMAIAFLFVKLNKNWILSQGLWLSIVSIGVLHSLLLLGGNKWSFLLAMFVLGSAMAFRQISAELVIFETISENESHSAPLISIYNSIVAFAYIFGYALSSMLSSFKTGIYLASASWLVGGIYQYLQRKARA